MMFLFQIGTARLYHDINSDDAVVSRKVKSNVKSKTQVWSPEKIFSYGGHSIDYASFSITEPLLDTQFYTKPQRVSLYNNMLSQPAIDLFAYRYVSDKYVNIDTGNFDPLNDGMIWLHNTGIVKSVTPNWKNSTLKIELDTQPFWEPINRYHWDFVRHESASTTSTPAANAYDDLSPLPGSKDFPLSAQHFWVRKFYTNELFLFDPDTWAYWHSRLPQGYPRTGSGIGLSASGSHSFTVPDYEWSAFTRSLYQFTEMPAQDNLVISVSSDGPYGSRLTNVAALDLSDLDTDMAAGGYTGLLQSDTIVVGDYKGKKSFIIRSSTPITDITPKWVYDGGAIGEAGLGLNSVVCAYPYIGPSYNTQIAQLHNFRVL